MQVIATYAASALGGKMDPGTLVTKLGRFYYTTTAVAIGLLWYTGWRNERVAVGDLTNLPVPLLSDLPSRFAASRPDSGDTPPGALSPAASAVGTAIDTGVTAGAAGNAIQGAINVGQAAGGKVTISGGANRNGVGLAPELILFLQRVSALAGTPLTVGTGTNHNRLTVDGNVSDHWDGHAADLPYNARTTAGRQAGDIVAAAAMIAAGAAPNVAHQNATRGGLFNFTFQGHRVQVIWKTMQGGDHFTHVHVGFR